LTKKKKRSCNLLKINILLKTKEFIKEGTMSKSLKIIIISIICVVLITGGTITYLSLNPKPELNMLVLADTHLLSHEQIGDGTSQAFINYDNKVQKMVSLSEAILKSAVDDIIKSDVKFVLIAGDLVDNGAKVSHEVMASELKRIEDNGIEVFVINGNHDVYYKTYTFTGSEPIETPSVTKKEFKEIYADFGYNQATEVYGDTLSYVADLDDKYRLIAIDPFTYLGETSDNYYSSKLSEEHLNWIKNQIEKCKADKKTPIGLTHIPLTEHFKIGIPELKLSNNVIENYVEVSEFLCSAGLNYIFTGHMHSQDIAVIESENGNTLYDIQTASLTNYPLAYREIILYRKNIEIKTLNVNNLNQDYIPSFLAEDMDLIKADFFDYSYDFIDRDMYNKLMLTFNDTFIMNLLTKLEVVRNESNATLYDNTVSKIKNDIIIKLLNLPIYEKDSNGGICVESIAKQYGITLEPSKYTSIFNFAMEFLKSNYRGDENYAEGCIEKKLIKYCIYSVFYMLDYSNIFVDLNSLNSEIPVFDLSSTMNKLFNEGRLELIDNNLLKNILSLSILPEELSGFKNLNMSLALGSIKNILKSDIMGLNFYDYLDDKEGEILLGSLFDNLVFKEVAKDFMIDNAPADNNIKINKKTLEWKNL
jgi:predicted MPP superfamily phosphohydrolase